MLGPFGSFYESEQAVPGTCLIRFDRNRYSVMAKTGRRRCRFAPMPIGSSCAAMERSSPTIAGCSVTTGPCMILGIACRCWRLSPVPIRNGASFQNWELLPRLAHLRRELGAGGGAGRRPGPEAHGRSLRRGGHHGPQRKRTATAILADPLRAETPHRHAASIRYPMAAAKLPAVKDLDVFVFDDTLINEGLVRSLHSGAFSANRRNIVLYAHGAWREAHVPTGEACGVDW